MSFRIRQILKMLLSGLLMTVLSSSAILSHAEEKDPLRGVVRDSMGDPLPGVRVVVQGTKEGTVTSADGGYTIKLQVGQVIRFSYVGFDEVTIVWDGTSPQDITLRESTDLLDELVVVGYGSQKKVNLTGAVSQVGGDVLENRPLPNLARGLQGMVPNLNISMPDGSPTRSVSFNVRGRTSIGAGGSALVLIDGVEGDPSMINPNDIKSISVLKDAASSAIYGSRAAFGVVLITTKQASEGKIHVNVSSNYSINQPTVVPKLNTDGYSWAKNFSDAFNAWYDYKSFPISVNNIYPFSAEYLDELKAQDNNPGAPEAIYNESKGRYWYFGDTDWYKTIYKSQSFATEQAASISGGSDRVRMYASARYYFQDGIFNYNADKFHKYNLRLKGSVKITPWLTFDENVEYNKYSYKYPMLSDGDGNIWRQFEHQGYPIAVLRNPDGTYTHSAVYNGVAAFIEQKNKSLTDYDSTKSISSLTGYALDNRLMVKADFTFSKSFRKESRSNNYIDYSIRPGEVRRFGKSLLRTYNDQTSYLGGNITAQYKDTFQDKHHLTTLLGYNIEKQSSRRLSTSRDGLLSEQLPDYDLMDGLNYSIGGGGSDWAFMGLFYRLAYDYQGRYLIETNGRYDGSSKFPKSQRFGFFPSLSVGWRISDESFMSATHGWLDNLKIRASYGSLGNGNVPPYRFLETMGVGQTSVLLNGVKKTYTSMPNVIPDGLTWETANTLDFGLDANLFNNRLEIILDWYDRQTKDMFTESKPLPSVFGIKVPFGNYADMSTTGWEATISWKDQFDLGGKDFFWSIRASLWDSTSKITRFNNDELILGKHYKGEVIGEIWGYETLGFFKDEDDIKAHADQSYLQNSNNRVWLPGDLKFADLNNDHVINQGSNTVSNPGDRRIIGNNSPRYQFGLNLSANWSNVGLSLFFQGVGKRDWYFSPEAGLFYGPYNRPYGYQPTYLINNHWTEEKPDAYFPRFRGYTALGTKRSLGAPQTRYLQDASYIRLKNITLTYNLAPSVLSKLKLTKAQLYLTGQNVLTYSNLFKHAPNFDPEVIENPKKELTNGQGQGYAYPMLKSWTLGLQITY